MFHKVCYHYLEFYNFEYWLVLVVLEVKTYQEDQKNHHTKNISYLLCKNMSNESLPYYYYQYIQILVDMFESLEKLQKI